MNKVDQLMWWLHGYLENAESLNAEQIAKIRKRIETFLDPEPTQKFVYGDIRTSDVDFTSARSMEIRHPNPALQPTRDQYGRAEPVIKGTFENPGEDGPQRGPAPEFPIF